MNWEHFKAFLWLRWRLGRNQLRRAGIANFVVLLLLAAAGILMALGMFVFALIAGLFLLPNASPMVLLYVWDGIVIAFLFWWLTGLLIELQRSELLSLDRFLHLPVSLSGAFLINYIASLLTISMIVFVPAMVGLCIGLVFAKGLAMLLSFILLAAFLFMITAVTHQFRGWLAALMVNKRRRRTIIMVVTISFILLAQAPNLINFVRPWKDHEGETKQPNGAITTQRDNLAAIENTVTILNIVVPLGWFPLGIMLTANGDVLSSLAPIAGMALLGGGSLWRSYKTTVRLYTGQFTSKAAIRPVLEKPPPKPVKGSATFLAKSLPWVSEHTSAITLACFRSLTRAPESKMLLLSPIILLVVFGGMFATQSMDPPEFVRPLMVTAGLAMLLLTLIQLVGNQFGFDRHGFRTFVLCAAPRREILFAKNLSVAPLIFALGLGVIAFMQIVVPMRFEHLLAAVPQLVSMFLLFCLMGNWLSIFAPMPIASGSLKPVNPKAMYILLTLLTSILFPVILGPTLLPLGIEFWLERNGWTSGAPVCLILSLLELGLVGIIYHFVLIWQGMLFQAREQRILEAVAGKVE